MKPEHPIIDPAIRADADRAVGQLPIEMQENASRLGFIARVLLNKGLTTHDILKYLKDLDPNAVDVIDALQEIP